MIERTICLVKPPLLYSLRDRYHAVVSIIEDSGLNIPKQRLALMEPSEIEDLYQDHREKPFFPLVVRQMSESPIFALLIEGENAAQRMRELAGPTSLRVAINTAPSSIRGQLGNPKETMELANTQNRALDNVVHTPNPEEEGAVYREGAIFFPDEFRARPIDIIREMNPGVNIPTGAELAAELSGIGSAD